MTTAIVAILAAAPFIVALLVMGIASTQRSIRLVRFQRRMNERKKP